MFNFILKLMIACILLPLSITGLILGVAMLAIFAGNQDAVEVLNGFGKLFFN